MTVADYKQSIIRIARAEGVDPSFVAGIMLLESGGQPSAGVSKFAQRPDGSWYTLVSYGQGVGLMQVVPVEAYGNWAGRPSVGQLLDPEFSIQYGTEMLRDNLARCGDKAGAACAYFSGHCVPTGASDPNASDYQYVQRALAAEQRFLDYNTPEGRMYDDATIDAKVFAVLAAVVQSNKKLDALQTSTDYLIKLAINLATRVDALEKRSPPP